MNDIELSMSAGAEIGRLYRDGKSFSEDAPVLALSFLRGFAVAYCNALDINSPSDSLSEKIKNLDSTRLLEYKFIKKLRILQFNGNKAAHPENYEFIDLNFTELVKESLSAAILLVEQIHLLRDGVIPKYEIAPVQSSAIKEMCFKAMLEQDVTSMYLAGTYFLERADKEPKVGFISQDGYPVSVKSDVEQAIFWLKNAAEKREPRAEYKYGYYLTQHITEDDTRLRQGEWFIDRAANKKNADALFYVGTASLKGTSYFEKDEVYAREVLEEAARQEHPGALAQLGAVYSLGLGGAIDKMAAANLTLRAAESGNPHAQLNLFSMYMNGDGVAKDELKGIRSLEDSASQNFPDAIYVLAGLIAAGQVPWRSAEDAIKEYERLIDFSNFRSRGAFYAAKLIDIFKNEVVDLLNAAGYLQLCYSLVVDDDPYQLRDECLEVCKKVVERIREHVNKNGLDPDLNGSEIFTSILFDKNCIPVVDREERIRHVASVINKPRSPSNSLFLVDFFIQEAHFKPQKSFSQIGMASSLQLLGRTQGVHMPSSINNSIKVGRNDPCPCGSGKKSKKCHGA